MTARNSRSLYADCGNAIVYEVAAEKLFALLGLEAVDAPEKARHQR